MTEWHPIDAAPKDRPLLLYGRLMLDGPAITADHPRSPIRVVGYWDDIDQAWALSSTPWSGPFFCPTLWALLPEPPSMTASGLARRAIAITATFAAAALALIAAGTWWLLGIVR